MNPPQSKSETRSDSREILDSLRRIVRALRVSTATNERERGLSSSQLFVLQKLAESEGICINELAEMTLTHQSSVSVVVSKLAKRGLVETGRFPDDGRKVMVSITPSGKNLIKNAPPSPQDELLQAIAKLPESGRKALARNLTTVVDELGIQGPAPMLFEDSPNR